MLNLAASDASLVGETFRHHESSYNSYFSVLPGNGKNYYIPPPSVAQFRFEVPMTGAYAIWVLLKSSSTANQGYYIYDGKGRWFTWLAGINTDWNWVKISDSLAFCPFAFEFTKGPNEFLMGWCDEDVRVDSILITNDFDYNPKLLGLHDSQRVIAS